MLATMQLRTFVFLSENVTITIYKNYNCTCSLYGCETWSLTIKEGHRLGLRTACLGEYLYVRGVKRWESWIRLRNERSIICRLLFSKYY